jgi:hypothetical protein
MKDENEEDNWVEKIGKPTFESLQEMVDALDFETVATNYVEGLDRQACIAKLHQAVGTVAESWAESDLVWLQDELIAQLNEDDPDVGFDREAAEQTILEDPLSVEVRSDWYTPGSEPEPPAEFKILLSWGGPATQIRGTLDQYGQPGTARLEVQDWYKPWTEYRCDEEVLLKYAAVFYYAE